MTTRSESHGRSFGLGCLPAHGPDIAPEAPGRSGGIAVGNPREETARRATVDGDFGTDEDKACISYRKVIPKNHSTPQNHSTRGMS